MLTGTLQSPFNEGEILAGKYRVERVIGRGGMGVVVAALNIKLEQRVALKFLLPEAEQHPSIVQRFAREARAAAKIKCDHVARVLDVDALPSGSPFMVMEYMEGEDLEIRLARGGPLSVEVAVGYILQACEALAEAHAVGIVHRDLKPGNLFLAKRPNGESIVKVLDFGISKSITPEEGVTNLTRTSSIMGSPLYMSPEQMTSAKNVDTRSDIWAVGVVLYELLTCTQPFTADGLPNLVLAVMHTQPPPLRIRCPEAPEGLERAIRRCLEKDLSRRFSTVAELAVAIAPYGPPRAAISVERISHVLRKVTADGEAPTLRPAPLPADPSQPTESVPDASPRNATNPLWTKSLDVSEIRSPKKQRAWLVVVPAALLLLGGLSLALKPSATERDAATQVGSEAPSSPTVVPTVPSSGAESVAPAPLPTAPAAETPSPMASVASTARAAPIPPARGPVVPKVAASTTPRSVKPRASSAPDCTVPYTYDGVGHRIPKPECL
jgi:serine/threonine-protein kinase